MRRILQLLALPILTLALVLAAAAFGPAPSVEAVPAPKTMKASRVAVTKIGAPYRYGATGPSAFDCSGLIQFSYHRAGIRKMPRTSSAQARAAHRIPKRKLRRGDLMFFHRGGRVYHAAIFLGWRKGRALMVHSPSTGKRVQRAYPWTNSWYAATMRG